MKKLISLFLIFSVAFVQPIVSYAQVDSEEVDVPVDTDVNIPEEAVSDEPLLIDDNPEVQSSLAFGDQKVPEDLKNPDDLGLRLKPDEQSGALTYSYSISTPDGRLGMNPNLSLYYNSQNEDLFSMYGYGWSVNIPYIKRISREGTEKLYETNYFYSSLAGELEEFELIDESHGVYFPESDKGSYLYHEYNSDGSWVVNTKDGVSYVFGLNVGDRLDDPSDSSRVAKWMLTNITDSNGNKITYSYMKSNGQIYPDKIYYTGYGEDLGQYEVRFGLEARPDQSKLRDLAFESVTQNRINSIGIYFNGELINHYALNYVSGSNGYKSLLGSITQTAINHQGESLILPATNFEYSGIEGGWVEDPSYSIPNKIFFFIDGSLEYLASKFIDVNGDGYEDLVYGKEGATDPFVYLNSTDGNGWIADNDYDLPIYFYSAFSNDYRGSKIADVNGDSYDDLLISTTVSGGAIRKEVHLNDPENKRWVLDTSYELPVYFATEGDDDDNGVRIADVNGDGLIDFVRAEFDSNFVKKVYINNADGTWTEHDDYNIPFLFYRSNDNDSGTAFMEVNGDGLVDVVHSNGLSDRQVYINQGNGQGWIEDTNYVVPVELYTNSSDEYMSIRIFDVNSDGLQDFVRSQDHGSGGVRKEVYFNKGDGTGWELHSNYMIPVSFYGEEYPDDNGVRISDVNGDGLLDIVQAEREGPGAEPKKVFINTHEKSDLLVGITDSLGATSAITYSSTATQKTGDELNNPNLSQRIHTVESVNIDYGYGDTAYYEYKYENGRYFYQNMLDRKFAGFERVTTTDENGNQMIKYFHQGNDSASFIGEYLDDKSKINIVYREEIYDSDGNLYNRVINKWDKVDVGTDSSFVYLAQSLNQVFDGDSDHRDTAESFEYDFVNGNLVQNVKFGEVNGDNDGDFTDVGSDKQIHNYQYADNGSRHYEVSSESLFNYLGEKQAEVKNYYDNQSFGVLLKGNLTKEQEWIQGSNYSDTEFEYNAYGLVITEIDPNGGETNTVYDSYFMYPASISNPLGQVRLFDYDYISGEVLTVTDPNGFVVETDYDGLGRQIEKRQTKDDDSGNYVVYSAVYNDFSSPRRYIETLHFTNNLSGTRHIYIDGKGRIIQSKIENEDRNFITNDVRYYENDLVEFQSLPYITNSSSFSTFTSNNDLVSVSSYDSLNRIVSLENILGSTEYNYDQWGVEQVDPMGNRKYFENDAFGNLVQVTEFNEGDEYETYYEYNSLNNLVRITDAVENIRNFEYDGLGRRTYAEDLHALGDSSFGVYSYEYDDVGNVTKIVDPRGVETVMNYDALNRKLWEDDPSTAGKDYRFQYDNCLNGVGRLCRVISGDGNYQLLNRYYVSGNLKVELKDIGGTGVNGIQYDYDRQGNVTKVIYPDGYKAVNQYNTLGLIDNIKVIMPNGNHFYVVQNVDYFVNMQPGIIEYGNGVRSGFEYDEEGLYRLIRKTTSKAGAQYQDIGYWFDAGNNITKIVNQSDSFDVNGENVGLSSQTTYEYDDLYRLISVQVINAESGDNYSRNYSYDSIGNLLNKSDVGSYSYSGAGFANPHAVTSAGGYIFDYDQAGNMIYDSSGWSHQWDYKGRLIESNGPEDIFYSYDYEKSRLSKSSAGETDYYFNKYFEFDGEGSIKSIYLGDMKIAVIDQSTSGNQLAYQHLDHLSGANIETDNNGNVISMVDYYPYGETRFEAKKDGYENDYKFTGQELDEESGLYYYGARYYHPVIGRFVSEDAWEGDYLDPQSLNKYSYVMNNPVKYTDPTGNSFQESLNWLRYGVYADNREIANYERIALKLQNSESGTSYLISKDTQKYINDRASDEFLGSLNYCLFCSNKSTVDTNNLNLNLLTDADLLLNRRHISENAANSTAAIFGSLNFSKFFSRAPKAATSFKVEEKSGFTYGSYTVPGRSGGQSRAEYVKVLDKNGDTLKVYKDSYSKDGSFVHRKIKYLKNE